MRVSVSKFMVRSFDLDHLDLFWEIEALTSSSETHEIFDYDFYIERSPGPMGPFAPLAGPFRDQYRLRDVTVSLLRKWQQYYYKLKVVHRPSGETKEWGPVTQEPEVDLIAAEIIRQEDILFREYAGRRCWLFPIRTFGPLCTCFDVTLGRRTRAAHLPCFGTGYLGGFHSPIEIFLQIDPVAKSSVASPLQEAQSQDTTARMISFPLVAPNDIIVETENKRWRANPVGGTERLRSPVRQELSLHAIPMGDIEFSLPVNVDTQSLTPAADRNFTNPQGIEQSNDSVDDILSFFGRGWSPSR